MTERIIGEIRLLGENKEQILVAVDGRCASGKTTAAEKLKKELSCNVIHMDDFFLRPGQRTRERYEEAGGNVDRERFLTEVLKPLKAGKSFSYCPFDCRSMSLSEAVTVMPNAVTVIEGTYSCHPALWDYYDLHIFLTVSREEQLKRIENRDAASLEMFRKKWIPLEERYFSEYKIGERCELLFKGSL